MLPFKNIFFIVIAVFLLIGCQGGTPTSLFDSEEFFSFDVSTVADKEVEVKLTDLMESIEVIQMDSVKEAFTRIFRVALSENYFLTFSSGFPAKLFSRKDGRFLRNIGRRGQGSGEYFQVWDAVIDESRKRIYLALNSRKFVYSYDLDGNFHPDETIYCAGGFWFLRPSIYVEKRKDRLVVFDVPYGATENTLGETLSGVDNICWVQDFKGKLLQNISSSQYIIPWNDSGIWASHFDEDSPVYSVGIDPYYACRKDTVYHYNVLTNKLYPVYTNNLHSEKLVMVSSRETPLHYYSAQQKFERGLQPEYETGYRLLQVDKRTREGRYIRVVNDYLGGIEFDPHYWIWFARDGYTLHHMDASELKEQLEEALASHPSMEAAVRKRVVKLKNTLTEESNYVLMICKFKTR